MKQYWGACVVLAAMGCGPKTMNDVGDVETESGGTAGSSAGATGGGGGQGTAAGGGGGKAGGSARHEWPPCRCTRREPELRCLAGSGLSQTVELGPQGGLVELAQGTQYKASGVAFSLDFPPRDSETASQVTLTETDLDPPVGFVDYSPVFLAEADPGFESGPILIRLPWGNRDGTTGRELALYTFSAPDEAPTRIADSYVNAGFMQGSTTELGFFFAGFPIEAESICP